MPTFAEMRAKVSRRIKDPNNTAVHVSDVGDTINESIKFWKQKRFWFNEIDETVTLVANDPKLPTLTTPILYLFKDDGLTLVDQSYRYVLRHIRPAEYDTQNIQQYGRPWAYTYRAGGYELYYYPEQTYPVRVHGIRDYVELVDDADTNDFLTYASDLIMFDCMSRVYAEFRQDYESADKFSTAADGVYRNLINRTSDNIATGTMAVENSFGDC